MIKFKTGDLLKSSADVLVNTVNCEGVMGKGIAYQFKQKFPDMFKEYEKVCKNRQLNIGQLHIYNANERIIVNFPTKITWREKSKIEYIELGLNELVKYIKENDIKSVAIPPLGSGNGGLNWFDVRKLIAQKMQYLSDDVLIEIYEPSVNYSVKPVSEPYLSISALVLMKMKMLLNKELFGRIGIQKTSYFFNIFYHKEYFRFKADQYGPYDDGIRVICRDIKSFQEYHNVETQKAYEILMRKLVSKNVEEKLKKMLPAIEKATFFSNSIGNIHDLEGVATVLFIIEREKKLSENEIIVSFCNWSDDKAQRFSEKEIKKYIENLEKNGILEKSLFGYVLSKDC